MPKTLTKALTLAFIKTAPEGVYSDGHGLTLLVDANGNRRWFQRLTIAGTKRNAGLGRFPIVSLSEARHAALENLRAVHAGRNPIVERRDARAAVALQAAIPTFSQAVDTVIELRKAGWSNAKHAAQWSTSLHSLDTIGNQRVSEITIAAVVSALEPIFQRTPTTASRLRQRMEAVFDWTIVAGYRADNPANKAVLSALPTASKAEPVHHESLPYAEVPGAFASIGDDTPSKSALRFLILTAGRLSEITGATWDEIDWETKIWTVPAGRMKGRKCHPVPLTSTMLEILRQAWDRTGGTGLVFSGDAKAVSNRTVQHQLVRLNIPCTPHGFRSSFRDWAIETNQDWETAEKALAHRLGTTVEAAYARTTLVERRRTMMEEWSEFVTG